MLKLNYIIAGILPQTELECLKRNLETGGEELAEKGWQFICLEEKTKTLAEYPPEEALVITADRQQLKAAAVLGIATILYLAQKTDVSEKDVPGDGAEKDDGLRADMYAEGMDEVDIVFLNRVYQRHHNLPWTILETERCVVREFAMDDLDALFELYAGEGMTDYMEPLYDYEAEKEYQQAYISHMYRFYGYGMWIVCDKKTGKMIGRAGVEHREELDGEPELGYAIGTPYQKQGYATEVCSAILTYIKEELEMPHIFCLIEERNRVSVHLAEKLGFSFEEDQNLDGKIMKKYKLTFEN